MSSTNKHVFSCSFAPELVEKIDEKRGVIPRSTYLENMVSKFLEGEHL